MDTHGLVIAKGNTTVSKTRVLAGGHSVSKQQIVRIDRDGTIELPDSAAAQLAEAVRGLAGTVDGVIVSDYGYNVCTDEVVAALREVAQSTPVLVDSHHRLPDFAGATIATPNEEEMEYASGVDVDDEAALAEAGATLRAEVDLNALLITRGNRGMMLVEPEATHTIPIVGPSDVADVTGAGDTVAAVTMLGRAAGGSFLEAAWLANHAAGVVVMKIGAATLTPDELRAALTRGPAQ